MLTNLYKISVTFAIIGHIYGNSKISDTALARCHRLRTYSNNYISLFPITKTHNEKSIFLSLYVKSDSDASILLSPSLNQTTDRRNTYEIILRSKKFRKSEIRWAEDDVALASHTEENSALPDEWRSFWIQVSPNGLIRVGKETGSSPFLSWKGAQRPLKIVHVGFASFEGIPVHWAFRCPENRSVDTDLTQCVNLNTTQYEYEVDFPVVHKEGTNFFLPFYVKARTDAHIILSSTSKPTRRGGEAYEIIIGGWHNTASAIRNVRAGTEKIRVGMVGLLSPKNWRHFWIRVSPGGLIEVGTEIGSPAFMSWKDEPPKISSYMVASYDNGTVHWALECSKRKHRHEYQRK